jgi:hypothetical protein
MKEDRSSGDFNRTTIAICTKDHHIILLMIHVVYFWLKKDLSTEQRATFLRELTLLTKIPYLAQAFAGEPAAVKARSVVDLSFDFSLMIQFKNLKDHDYYQLECKDHRRFLDNCKSLWEKVVVYDSTIL